MLLNSLLNKDSLKLFTASNQVETPSPKVLKNGSSRKKPIAAHSKSANMTLLSWLWIGEMPSSVSGLDEPPLGFSSFIVHLFVFPNLLSMLLCQVQHVQSMGISRRGIHYPWLFAFLAVLLAYFPDLFPLLLWPPEKPNQNIYGRNGCYQ